MGSAAVSMLFSVPECLSPLPGPPPIPGKLHRRWSIRVLQAKLAKTNPMADSPNATCSPDFSNAWEGAGLLRRTLHFPLMSLPAIHAMTGVVQRTSTNAGACEAGVLAHAGEGRALSSKRTCACPSRRSDGHGTSKNRRARSTAFDSCRRRSPGPSISCYS